MNLGVFENNEGRYLEMKLASGERVFVDWENEIKMRRPNQRKAIFTLVLSSRAGNPCFWCKKGQKYLTLTLTGKDIYGVDKTTFLNCTRMSLENEREFLLDWLLILKMAKEFCSRFASELRI